MKSSPFPATTLQTKLIRVAIVEDTAEVRDGLTYLVNASEGLTCVATCATAEDGLERLPDVLPDVVLMDIGLPGMSGIECIRLLKVELPRTQIMMLTVFEDDERIFQSLAAGATGYLIKNTAPVRLLESIRDLHAGGSPMSNQIARRLVREFQKDKSACETSGLSPRENEILQLLSKGLLYKEIADKLSISRNTVRTHLRNIYEKLHVRTRTEAVMKAYSRS